MNDRIGIDFGGTFTDVPRRAPRGRARSFRRPDPRDKNASSTGRRSGAARARPWRSECGEISLDGSTP